MVGGGEEQRQQSGKKATPRPMPLSHPVKRRACYCWVEGTPPRHARPALPPPFTAHPDRVQRPHPLRQLQPLRAVAVQPPLNAPAPAQRRPQLPGQQPRHEAAGRGAHRCRRHAGGVAMPMPVPVAAVGAVRVAGAAMAGVVRGVLGGQVVRRQHLRHQLAAAGVGNGGQQRRVDADAGACVCGERSAGRRRAGCATRSDSATLHAAVAQFAHHSGCSSQHHRARLHFSPAHW